MTALVSRRRTGRRGHPVLVFVVVLGLLFVVVDRVADRLAERVVADKLQQAEDLGQRPHVSIAGFPLLTQVAAQRYREVDVTVRDVRRGPVSATWAEVHLHGVHVGTGALLSGDVRRIPVDRADGSVLFGYGDLDRMLRDRGVTVGYDQGDRVRVSGSFTAAGQRLSATGTATIRVEAGDLVVAPQSVDVGGGSLLGSAVSELARGRLTVRLPLPDLPFGVRVDAVTVRSDGVLAHAVSSGLVIDVR